MVDLTRFVLICLLRFFDLCFVLMLLSLGVAKVVALSVAPLRSLSQSTMLPILIFNESHSVDTRLPYIKTHKINHTITTFVCKYFDWIAQLVRFNFEIDAMKPERCICFSHLFALNPQNAKCWNIHSMQ